MCLATPCITSNVQIIAMVKLLSLYGSLCSHQTAWNKCTYEKSVCVPQGTRNVCWCKITCLLTMITSFRRTRSGSSILHEKRCNAVIFEVRTKYGCSQQEFADDDDGIESHKRHSQVLHGMKQTNDLALDGRHSPVAHLRKTPSMRREKPILVQNG
jgi:hypothetical protein